MKVICSNVKDSRPNPSSKSDGWLTVGKIYSVLTVHGDQGTIKYRIASDRSGTPFLAPSEQFEIVSPGIPSDWVFSILKDGSWELTPRAWSAPEFWENFFNQDPEAEAVYAQTLATLEAQDRDPAVKQRDDV